MAERIRGRRLDPGELAGRASATRVTESHTNRDPGQPGAERSFASPRTDRSIGGQESLLGGVFGVVKVTEHSIADTHYSSRLAFDDRPKRIAIATEDGSDGFVGEAVIDSARLSRSVALEDDVSWLQLANRLVSIERPGSIG